MSNISSFDLLSLFGKEQLNDIQHRLSKITKLGFITVDYRGEPMTEYTGFCDFCSHFRLDETLSKNCVASDAMSSIQAAISERPRIYMCPCGLMEIAIPIIVNGTYLGGFLCGQALCSDPPADILRMKPATDIAVFQQMLKKAEPDLQSLPCFDYQHFEDIADLVNLVITLLCENKIVQLDHEKALRSQIVRTAFLDTNVQKFMGLMQDTDYRQMMRAIPDFVDTAFEQVSSPEDRIQLLKQFIKNLDRTDGHQGLSLFPLRLEDVQSRESANLWLSQLLDYQYRKNKAREFPILESIFEYINQHITEKLTLSLLVERCSISQSYISRLFRVCFQISATDYIHLHKLLMAKRYLLRDKKTVEDIAYLLGYNEYTYFSKVFKKYEGMTIQEYKDKLRFAT